MDQFLIKTLALVLIAGLSACSAGYDFMAEAEKKVRSTIESGGDAGKYGGRKGVIKLVNVTKKRETEGEFGGVKLHTLVVEVEIEFLEDGNWSKSKPFSLYKPEPSPFHARVKKGDRRKIERNIGFRKTDEGWKLK